MSTKIYQTIILLLIIINIFLLSQTQWFWWKDYHIQQIDNIPIVEQEKLETQQDIFIPTEEQRMLLEKINDITEKNERTKEADEVYADWMKTLKTEDALKNIPLTNQIWYSTNIPDWEERTEAVRGIFFQKESFCIIPQAQIVQQEITATHERKCPSLSFQDGVYMLEDMNKNQFSVHWVQIMNIDCGEWSGWWEFLLDIGFVFQEPEKQWKNIILDKNYSVLYHPFEVIYPPESWDEYRKITQKKVDVSSLPECEPNVK